MHTDEMVALNRRAVHDCAAVVARAGAADLARPTPCAGWTLTDLLAHMAVQHDGFAAAARGAGGDPAVWRVRPLGPDPVGEYRAAAERVLAAFADDGVADREFALAEFGPDVRVPAVTAMGFHLVDYVVHGWDVAATLGVGYRPDPAACEAALRVALAVPDGENRGVPGAAFAHALAAPETADPLDRILAALGRSPSWSAAGSPSESPSESPAESPSGSPDGSGRR